MKRLIMIIWLLLVVLFINTLGAKPRRNGLTCAAAVDPGSQTLLCRSAADRVRR